MRVLIFHGYLLNGTGSNVYNARLAEALVGMGHEVHLLCQDRHPERCQFASAAGDWDSGKLKVRALDRVGVEKPARQRTACGSMAAPAPAGGARAAYTAAADAAAAGQATAGQAAADGGSCTLYRPDIGGLLPVYVQDRYEGIQARTFADCSDAEVEAYLHANVQAVREIVARVRPDVALANHLVMGPAILARALGGQVPYAVKVHGSALEYTVKPQPERFLGHAREGLAQARAVLVGSNHTAQSLWQAMGDTSLPSRTRLGPPGVDVHRFRPRERAEAEAAVHERSRQLRARAEAVQSADSSEANEPASVFARDERAVADALERVLSGGGELVAFVGKLIDAKGVDLLLGAWPLVLESRPRARLLVIGFGSERERYEAAAAPLGESVIFTGRLEHDELPEVLSLCEALVVPSTFPEAFGMVAIEAAACGALPVSAAHSGLAEVSQALAAAAPAEVGQLLSFPVDDDAVRAIATRVTGWLQATPDTRLHTREALVALVRERWSWEGVARGVIAAARGESESPLARAVG